MQMQTLQLAEVDPAAYEIATMSGALYWLAGEPAGSWRISRTARFGGQRSWLSPSDEHAGGHEIMRPLPTFAVGKPTRLLVLDETLGHGLSLVTTQVIGIRLVP